MPCATPDALSTFEGPMLAIKSVNVISHYTDWTVGHAHSGALGWNAFVTFGTVYFLVPKLLGASELYSKRLVNIHFLLALLGVLIYAFTLNRIYFTLFTWIIRLDEIITRGHLFTLGSHEVHNFFRC
jgi:cbb3-type cytochrome oxidase subunit 1